ANAPVRVLVRPDDIVHDDDSPLTARIKKKAFRGESYLYTLELPSGQELLSLVHSHHNHDVGTPLGIKIEVKHLVVFPAAEGTH
ncbi:MAG: TOBE domain-containing protein, partial [Gammaproteobacteria bacterium]|nr:TOBE domain-containing protein [Gammaproteobacteria bacterium]